LWGLYKLYLPKQAFLVLKNNLGGRGEFEELLDFVDFDSVA
jgi:hypothetical protein